MGLKGKKLTELNLGKNPKNSCKLGFFGFYKNFKPILKIVHYSVLYDSVKTACLGSSVMS